MPKKNDFKPVISLLGVIILVLVCLACWLPYWLSWDATGSALTTAGVGVLPYYQGLALGNVQDQAVNLNAGLWETEVTTKMRGVVQCVNTAIDGEACVCDGINDNDIDVNADDALSANNETPVCAPADIEECEGDRVGLTANVRWQTKVKTECDPHLLAAQLRCGARYDDNDVVDIDANGNGISDKCATGDAVVINKCMRDWIRSGQGTYIIAVILTALGILLYLIFPWIEPPKLPMLAMVGIVLTFLNALAVTWGLISAVVAFRHGCQNDWDALPGKTQWSYCLGIGITAIVLAWAWFCWAIYVWREAKEMKNWWLYERQNYYGKVAPVYAPGVAPGGPMYYGPTYVEQPAYVDYGDAAYYPPAAGYPAYSAYGYGAEGVEGGYGDGVEATSSQQVIHHLAPIVVHDDAPASALEGYTPAQPF